MNTYLSNENIALIQENGFKPNWLISDIDAPVWVIITRNGKTISIRFDDLLPNLDSLSDLKYAALVRTIKQILIIRRDGIYSKEYSTESVITRASHQYAIARSLKLIVKFAILRDVPIHNTNFNGLTKDLVRDFYKTSILGVDHLDGTYYLFASEIKKIAQLGKLDNYITKKGSIRYKAIANRVHPKFRYRLSKTTKKELLELLPNSTSKSKREIQDRKEFKDLSKISRNPDEKKYSISSIQGLVAGFNTLARIHSIFPETKNLNWLETNLIPTEIHPSEVISKKRTPTIPLDTGLEYVNEAIKWVLCFGEDLLTTYSHCQTELQLLLQNSTSRRDYYSRKIEIPLNKTTQSLKIRRYNQNPTNVSYSSIRSNLSLEEAIDCLVGAIFIIVGLFSARRVDEILSLNQNCIRIGLDGEIDLVFGLEKASPSDYLSEVGRPLPPLAEKAISLLVDLMNIQCPENTNPLNENPLFFHPLRIGRKEVQIKRITQQQIRDYYLPIFSDTSEISTTSNSKGESLRWYLSPHQLRRFFAMTYYWHMHFEGLSALSWFMGHSDTEQTMRYITESIEGLEITKREALLSIEALIQDNQDLIENDSLRKYMDTRNIDIIDINHAHQFLEKLKRSGRLLMAI